MTALTLAWTSLVIGVWTLGNGILHDIYVVKEHKEGYNRHLLYLLLNGHIIILHGVLEMIAFPGLRDGLVWGQIIAGIASLSLIMYCLMVWRFLPSIVTILLQTGLLIMVAVQFFKQ